jgi:hypothetical protein
MTMTKPTDMYLDIVDRTHELLEDPRESFSELAWHTGLDQKWIAQFACCTDDEAHRQDPSEVVMLFYWLILLELAADEQRFGPDEALLVYGEVAVYEYKQRHDPSISGLFNLNERAHIVKRAEARLEELRARARVAA